MKTNINIKALKVSPKNETLLLEANTRTSSILTPKPLKHDQISFLEEWKLPDILPLKHLDSSTLNQIIENPSDKVTLKLKNKPLILENQNYDNTFSKLKDLPRSSNASSILDFDP